MPQTRKHLRILNIDPASVKPIIHLEQLEPRILLSGDSLLNIAIDPQQDTIIDNTPQVVQYVELLDINEQVEEQFNLEPAQSDGPNADTYQPNFTLLAEDDNRNDEPVDADLSVDNIDPNQVNGEIAVLSNDSDGDIEGKVGTTEDDSMPTNINDADLSIEYATSIEIRGPPTSETVTLQGMYLVDPTANYFDGQIFFLDFDGEQDVTYNGPVIVEDINIPEFSAKSGGLDGQDQEIISQILTTLEQKFESTGVQFTTSVPAPGTSYSTIFVGGGDSAFAQYGSFLGLAEKIDVGNQDSGDNAFVFSDTIRARYADNDDCLKRLANVIAHETAHLLGYAHDSVYSSEGMLASVSNSAPVANDDTAVTDEDTPVNVDVLANDTDAENDPLSITILGSTNATALVNDGGTPANQSDDTVDVTPDAGFYGMVLFTYQVNDGNLDSNVATVMFTITEVEDPLQVVSLETDPSGFTVYFNRPLDSSVLNLYDGLDGGYGATDVTVVGSAGGVVRGSLVYDDEAASIHFIQTGQRLLDPNVYTITLSSGENAFKDLAGNLLDGDADGVAGGDYVTTIAVSLSFGTRVVSLPDFVRGPGQDITLLSSGPGIPVSVDGALGIMSVDFAFEYDPAFLEVTGISLSPALSSSGWFMFSSMSTPPGRMSVSLIGMVQALSGADVELVTIQARVPDDAVYAQAAVLKLVDVEVNNGIISAVGDNALQVVAYLGDSSGNYGYSAHDAALIARVVGGLDSGFAAYRLKDPVLVGDVTGNGSLSSNDARSVFERSVFLPVPEIPDLPGVSPIISGGPDPLLSIPNDISAYRDDTVIVPVFLDDAGGLLAADIHLEYDPDTLDLTTGDVHLGSLTGGWALISNIDAATGQAWIGLYDIVYHSSGNGSIAELEFFVRSNAAVGATIIDLLDSCQLNEGGLILTLQDGELSILDGNAPTVVANNTQIAVDEGSIAGNTGTFSDVDQGDSVAITPSIGTVTQIGTQTGTWSWSFNTTNGPVESQIVTITATDSSGGFTTTTFDLVVNNVAPVLSNVEFIDGTTYKSALEGDRQYVMLVGDWTDPGTDDIFRVEIDWGDGTSKTIQTYGAGSNYFSLSHRFEDDYGPGPVNTNPIIVKVFDDDSLGMDNTVSFTAFNENPTLQENMSIVTGPSQLVGNAVILAGTIYDPGVLDWFTLDVDWGDGNIEAMVITKGGNNPNLDSAGNFTVSHVYNNARTDPYPIRVLGLTDDDGGEDTQDRVMFPSTVGSVTIIPVNEAPVANDDTAVTDEDTPVNVDVLANDTDVDGDPLTITISSSTNCTALVNDGGTPADPRDDTVDVTPDAGFYGTVQFTYRVNNGEFDSNEATVTITVDPVNNAPTVVADNTQIAVDEGSIAGNTGTFNDVDQGDLVVITSSIGTITQTGTQAGTWNWSFNTTDGPVESQIVTITATDSDGEVTTTTFDLVVNNVAPTGFLLNGGPINEGVSGVVFVAAPFDPSNMDTLTGFFYRYDFGADGTFETSWLHNLSSKDVPAEFLDDPGLGIVVEMKDKDGGVTAMNTFLDVMNVAPTVDAGADGSTDEGQTFTGSGSFADPGPDSWTATVNYGDGSGDQPLVLAGTTFDLSHTYVDDGTYTVTVCVTDDDGWLGSDTITVTVNNVAPAVDAGSDQTVSEGEVVNFSGSFTDSGVLDTHTYLWDFGDGTTSDQLSPEHIYADDGQYTVTFTVTDDDGGVGADSLIVTVENIVPTISALSVTPEIDENGVVTLTGQFTDPGVLDSHTVVIDWADSTVDTLVIPVGGRSFSAEHQYLDDEPSGTEQDDYTIEIVLTDIEGGQDTASTAITVNNVAPEIVTFSTGSSGCEGTTSEPEVSIFAEFTDVGILDSHTATINWGDGTSTTGQITEADGTGSVTASHIYTSGGIYNITLTVTDDDTGEDIQVAIKAITGVKVTDGVLQIIGTCGDDHVTVNMTSSCKSSQLKVHANFLPHKGKGNKNNGRGFEVFDAAEINKIVVLVCEGNDIVTIVGNIKITTLIDGGAGNDKLKGGAGADIILGAEGNDMLIGGHGRDILIGGDGCDRIIGNAGDDILIGGTTLFDIDDSNLGQAQVILGQEFDEALMSILAEWNSKRDFDTRVNNLKDSSGSNDRLNGLHFLQKDVTVFNDGVRDYMNGSSGKDWLISFESDKNHW